MFLEEDKSFYMSETRSICICIDNFFFTIMNSEDLISEHIIGFRINRPNGRIVYHVKRCIFVILLFPGGWLLRGRPCYIIVPIQCRTRTFKLENKKNTKTLWFVVLRL